MTGLLFVVPYWAVWPFETLLLISDTWRQSMSSPVNESGLLADILRQITTRYDDLSRRLFLIRWDFISDPVTGSRTRSGTSMDTTPSLLRSATVQKFMVGYELLASPQRDITPEAAAARSRVAAIHYLARG